jgi:hypothetical protein
LIFPGGRRNPTACGTHQRDLKAKFARTLRAVGKQKAMKKLLHISHKDKTLHGAAVLGPERAAMVLPISSEEGATLHVSRTLT